MKILEEVESPVNGKLQVIRDLTWGTHITAAGLTQSGGIARKIWEKPLKKIHDSRLMIHDCLILGLGAGGIVPLIQKYWPEAKITGVEIDPVMIKLGTRYLGLGNSGAKIVTVDAFDFAKRTTQRYDLVSVDTYVGDQYPKKFESEQFLELVPKLLTKNGTVVFNRLYYDEKRAQAMKFLKKLEKIFPKVNVIYPTANVMFMCSG